VHREDSVPHVDRNQTECKQRPYDIRGHAAYADGMTLNPHPSYPAAGAYVLKLHRDAQPRLGQLRGRLEHIVSGECIEFHDGRALLDWLAQHASLWQVAPAAAGDGPPPSHIRSSTA
jgi:hypothetical protein